MTVNASLFRIEEALADLMDAREEALDQLIEAQGLADLTSADRADLIADRSLAVARIDEALVEYARQEIRKVDNIRGMWKHLENIDAVSMTEAEFNIQRSKAARRQLAALKSSVLFAMSEMEWRTGKPRKLEGRSGSISIKNNGGKQPVVITDEKLIPIEYCYYEGRIPAWLWRDLRKVADTSELGQDMDACIGLKRVPSLTLIGEALAGKCESCEGRGHQRDPVFEEHISPDTCSECGGSGRAGVPGAALEARGEHAECR